MSSLPPTRSRTLLFLSYRDSASHTTRKRRYPERSFASSEISADEEQERLIPGDGHSAIDVNPPPIWVDVSDDVEDILQSTVTKINALDKLHAKHVLPGFADRSAEEREIENLTNEITRSFRKCSSLVQQITPNEKHMFPPSESSSLSHESKTARNVQRGLAAKVQEVSGSFRKKQRVYLENLQGHSIKNQDLLLASGALSTKGSESVLALEEDVEAASQTQARMQLDPNLQIRDRELRKIAESIASLAELFRDLSGLVIDQGTILDSVEFNVENTAIQMEEAVKELNTAKQYQRNTGRRKCIFLLILLIIGLILVLIFKPRKSANKTDPSRLR